ALIAFQALAFYSVARMLDHPVSGSVTLGFALAAAFLARGWIGSLPIMLAVLFIFMPGSALWRQKKWLLISAVLSAALILLWWIPATHASEYWTRNWLLWNTTAFGWPDYHEILKALRDLPWFIWPTWPLALLAIWRWRSWLTAPHIW